MLVYNYFVDENIRKALNIKTENSIIIMDEAHNVENIAVNSFSA